MKKIIGFFSHYDNIDFEDDVDFLKDSSKKIRRQRLMMSFKKKYDDIESVKNDIVFECLTDEQKKFVIEHFNK